MLKVWLFLCYNSPLILPVHCICSGGICCSCVARTAEILSGRGYSCCKKWIWNPVFFNTEFCHFFDKILWNFEISFPSVQSTVFPDFFFKICQIFDITKLNKRNLCQTLESIFPIFLFALFLIVCFIYLWCWRFVYLYVWSSLSWWSYCCY